MQNGSPKPDALSAARGLPLAADGSAGADETSVSVIIAVYNGARFVARAIDSVLAQTHPANEILVIDDGSTDNTLEIVRRYGDAVKVISQSNGGVSKARNLGLTLAVGRYIAFLDADDWWYPRKLEVQVAAMRATPRAGANYTSLTVVDSLTEKRSTRTAIDPKAFARELQWCNPGVPPSSMLLSKEALDRVGYFDESLLACEDWDLWLRIVRAGYEFSLVSEPLTYYVTSPTGLSGDANLMFRTFLQILEPVLLAHRTGLSRWIWRRRILSFQAYKAGLTARGEENIKRERHYIGNSIMKWPSPFWASERFKAFAVTFLRSR